VLSPLSRRLTTLAGLLFLALGIAMFVAPHWAARNFPWKASPFLAMTIGAWYLGGAVFAFECVRIRRLATIYAALAYLTLFSALEALVIIVHAGDLDFGRALVWPYIAALATGVLASLAGVFEILRSWPSAGAPRIPVPRVFRVASIGFVIAVALLALPLLDGYDSPPSIWPAPLTLASARSFAAFFGALALSATALVFARDLAPVLMYLRTAIFLNVVITVAAIVFIGKFDFRAHPGQLLYIGLYLFVLAGASIMIAYGSRRATEPPAAAQPAVHV
jgi:hypothetical protein